MSRAEDSIRLAQNGMGVLLDREQVEDLQGQGREP
jgi:hypothetical protein